MRALTLVVVLDEAKRELDMAVQARMLVLHLLGAAVDVLSQSDDLLQVARRQLIGFFAQVGCEVARRQQRLLPLGGFGPRHAARFYDCMASVKRGERSRCAITLSPGGRRAVGARVEEGLDPHRAARADDPSASAPGTS
jgi:hypothetical protein